MSNVVPIHERTSGPTDAALVVSARAGEAWAREALFRRHSRAVHGLAFRLVGRDQDVDDIAQDAWVAAFDSLHRIADPQAFAAFLGSIVVHCARRVLRRRRLARRLGLLPQEQAIDASAFVARTAPPDTASEILRIYGVIHTLPTDERIAILLRRVEGMQLEEVAAACKCSLATAKRRIAAADEKLRAAQEGKR